MPPRGGIGDFRGGDAWVEEGGIPVRQTTADTKSAVSGKVVVESRGSWVF